MPVPLKAACECRNLEGSAVTKSSDLRRLLPPALALAAAVALSPTGCSDDATTAPDGGVGDGSAEDASLIACGRPIRAPFADINFDPTASLTTGTVVGINLHHHGGGTWSNDELTGALTVFQGTYRSEGLVDGDFDLDEARRRFSIRHVDPDPVLSLDQDGLGDEVLFSNGEQLFVASPPFVDPPGESDARLGRRRDGDRRCSPRRHCAPSDNISGARLTPHDSICPSAIPSRAERPRTRSGCERSSAGSGAS